MIDSVFTVTICTAWDAVLAKRAVSASANFDDFI
jgi:hypothetical protein